MYEKSSKYFRTLASRKSENVVATDVVISRVRISDDVEYNEIP